LIIIGKTSQDILKGIAMVLFFFVISSYFPIIGFLCTVFIPIPILYYRSKLGRAAALILTATVIFIIGVLIGRISFDVMFLAGLILLGFILGELIELNYSLERVVLLACLYVFFLWIACLFCYSSIIDKDIFEIVTEYINKNLEFTMTLYESMGMSSSNKHIISSVKKVEYVLVRTTPAIILSSMLLISWLTILMVRPIFAKNNIFFPDFGRLNRWKAPEILVWYGIGSGVFLFLPQTIFKLAGLNGLIVLMVIYFLQGIAIVSYYFEKKRISVVLKVFLYVLVVVQQFFFLVVVGVGLFDMWFDFRRLKKT